MNNDLLIPGSKNLATVPSYAQATEESKLLGDMGGAAITRLTFKGNRFRLHMSGEETVLEDVRLNVIILDAYPKVSRVYYGGSYVPGQEATRPDCASADGEVPLASVPNPQSDTCASCPQNQKGSAITDDGDKRRACSFFKRIALLLHDYEDVGPVVADIRSLSLFGESFPDKAMFNLRAYAERLAKHQTKPCAIVTELSFDTTTSVPKILFKPVSYVDEATYFKDVAPLFEDSTVADLVDTTKIRFGAGDGPEEENPAQAGGFREKLNSAGQAAAQPAPQPAPPAAQPAPQPAPPAAAAAPAKKKVTRKAAEPAGDAGQPAAPAKKKVSRKAAPAAAAPAAAAPAAAAPENTPAEEVDAGANGEADDWSAELDAAIADFDLEM